MCDDRIQMLQVINPEIDSDLGKILRSPPHVNIVNVATMLANDLGDLRQGAGCIFGLDYKTSRVACRGNLVDIPANVEPTLGLVIEIF